MEPLIDHRSCLHCGKNLNGRSDKKYCDNFCRSAYNNRQKSESNRKIRKINTVLKKNRRILEKQIGKERSTGKCNREQLLQQGFHFKYFTHTYKNRKGQTYFYCYDYGYLPMDHGFYLVVKEQEKKRGVKA